jgi:hypothetical protein
MSAMDESNQDRADEAAPRYPLRARGFRQLNPYEYDRLLYKRQMQANPEAIVAYLSPRRQGKKEPTRTAELEDGWLVEDEVESGDRSERRQAVSSTRLQQTESARAAELIDGEDDHDTSERRRIISSRVLQEQKNSMLVSEPQESQLIVDGGHHSAEMLLGEENNTSVDVSDPSGSLVFIFSYEQNIYVIIFGRYRC